MDNPFTELGAKIDGLAVMIKELQKEKDQPKLLSPIETCKLFQPQISRVTLNNWTNSGKLVKYQIGGRVYYRSNEVFEAAKTLKRYK